MTFEVDIKDIIVNVEIVEDSLSFDIVEDHIDVDIVEDSINVDLIEDSFTIELVEDHIDVTLDDGCVCVGGGSGGDVELSDTYYQYGTLGIGDLVYPESGVDRTVIKALDNNTPNAVIGIVTSVVSVSVVEVTHLGFFDISVIIEQGKKVYLSESGEFTSVLTQTGYIQVLGTSTASNRLYLNPEKIRCKRFTY